MGAVSRLEFRLLGRFAVLRDGAELPSTTFGGRKVRTLLRILATRRGAFVSHDALTEMLWPQRPPADPVANLQVLVTRARKALGDGTLIRSGPGGYSLAGDAGCTVDTERFAAEVQRARRLGGRDALAVLTAALESWRGEPLAEDAYVDWSAEFRNRLLRMRQEALERASDLALDAGESAVAVEYGGAAAEAEPLRETAVLALVRALAAAGDPAAALSRYEQYRRSLADELGLDPSPEAAALQRRLLAGSGGRSDGTPAARRSSFTALPFVGREAELRSLLQVLGGGGATVLIGGASGSGKSRLLRELAARRPMLTAKAAAPEAVDAWSLARNLLREVLAQDVGYRDRLPGRLDAALTALLPELDVGTAPAVDAESRRALMQEAAIRLLGAVEHVIALDDLQWADPTSLALLETARARLPQLRLVLAYRPDELTGPAAAAVGRIDAQARLSLHGLARVAIGDVVADDALAEALVRHTDGTPLAVAEVLRALAGEGLTARDAADRWHAVDPGAVPRAVELGRHGQRQAIRARADRLAEPSRLVLHLLSLLGREVPAATLAAACDADEQAVLDRLSSLLRAGLGRLGELGWATSHDLVSDAVIERLDDAQRTRLHALLAGALAEDADDPAELARHWRGAGRMDLAAEAYTRAARRALDSFADREAEELAYEALALTAAPAAAVPVRELRAQARARLGDLAGAREDLRAALADEQAGPVRARLLSRLAMLASGSDDLVRAAELAELAVVEAADDDAAKAQALETAAILDMNLDHTVRAGERATAALTLYERLGDARGTARVLDAQAMATFLAGDVEQGGTALRRAADLFEDSGDLMRVVTPRSTSGHASVFAGRAEDGLLASTAARDLARLLGHPESQAYALWHRAEALSALARPAEAMRDAREALQIAQTLGHRGWTTTSWRAVGIAAQAAGDLDEALHAFETSLAGAEHLDLFAAWAAARAALVLLALGRRDRAAPLVTRALALGPPLGQYEARLAQAELAAATGDPAAAAIARTAWDRAVAGGVVQGRARLAELAGQA